MQSRSPQRYRRPLGFNLVRCNGGADKNAMRLVLRRTLRIFGALLFSTLVAGCGAGLFGTWSGGPGTQFASEIGMDMTLGPNAGVGTLTCRYSGAMTLDLNTFAVVVFGTFSENLTPFSFNDPGCYSSITDTNARVSGTFVGSEASNSFSLSLAGGGRCSLNGSVDGSLLWDYERMLDGTFSCPVTGNAGSFTIDCPIGGHNSCVSFDVSSASQTLRIGTATVLSDGRVVIIGGADGDKVRGAIELYTPAALKFTSSKAALLRARTGHTATLLTTGPQAGKILIAGGEDRQDRTSLASTELYDPITDAVTCIDGSQPSGSPATCPSSTKMIDARVGHSATLLGSGKVLLAGGLSTAAPAGGPPTVSTLATAELYDPVTERFTCVDGSVPTGNPPACPSATDLVHPRLGHTATVLKNGQVLLVGGLDLDLSGGTAETIGSAEIFDPTSGHFLPTSRDMISNRMGHSATLLGSGQVLLAGGMSGTAHLPDISFTSLNSAEIYDPASDTFTATGDLHTARVLHAAALRRDGKVIVGGGWDGTIAVDSGMAAHHPVSGRTLQSIEIFDPSTGSFSHGGKMLIPGAHQALIAFPPDSFPTQTE